MNAQDSSDGNVPVATAPTRQGNGTPSENTAQLTRREVNPFTEMRRMWEDFDRAFESWSTGRGWPSPAFRFHPLAKLRETWASTFVPDIEVIEKDGSVVVRADLPGIRKEDVQVEVNDSCLVIKGERNQSEETKKEGYVRSERSYGSFYRSIPLPDGIVAGDAAASFKDGVLEVVVKTRKNGRKIEVA